MAKLIVGFSQKVGAANFGSRGASVTLEVELDPLTAADAERTRVRTAELFDVVRTAVTDELTRAIPMANGHAAGPSPNGHADKPAADPPRRMATPNQVRAIVGLATRYHTSLAELLPGRFGVRRVEELALKDASTLIDELKAAGGNGHCS